MGICGNFFGWIRTVCLQSKSLPPGSMEKVIKTDAEWKKLLTSEQYDILRKKGTEAPNSCSLLKNEEKGTYCCVGCENSVFKSSEKFETKNNPGLEGWPSFDQAITGHVDFKEDNSYGMKRTEVLCAKCGGHLGHFFIDEDRPGKKHYCINGVVLKFKKIK